MRMTYDRWARDYRPVRNTFAGDAPYDGTMFETFGPEWEFVRQADPRKVWTLVDADGKLYVTSGLHFVNRMGYFVTEMPYEGTEPVDIKAE